ncbi:MAG TPA: FkbM family methyltransferase [Bryobacterales bacterium]|nr:FkbM family methyltransferase [Bryobacterales bacterium]
MPPRRLEPLVTPVDEARKYSADAPLIFRLALAWATYAPRGKGAVPRALSRFAPRVRKFSIRTNCGARLAVDNANFDIYTTIARLGGNWERENMDACFQVLRPGDVFYDVGANAGLISVEVAARHPDVTVFGFEPQPNLAQCIAHSIHLNRFDNLSVFQTMLGNREGTAQLHIPTYAVQASAITREQEARTIECRLTRLDHQIELGALPAANVIKMDAEGAEFEVLRGAERLIRDHQPCILFESDVNMERFGYSRRELCDYLRNLADYRFYYTGDRLRPADPELRDGLATDVLAVPVSSGRLTLS